MRTCRLPKPFFSGDVMVKVKGPISGQGQPLVSQPAEAGERAVKNEAPAQVPAEVTPEDSFEQASSKPAASLEAGEGEGLETGVDTPPVPRARKRSYREAFGEDFQVLPDDVRASYLQAVEVLKDVSPAESVELEAAADKVGQALKMLRQVSTAADTVDSGMASAANLLDSLEGAEAFCAACAAPPGMRSFKAVTGIVKIAERARGHVQLQKEGKGVQESLSTARTLEIVATFLEHEDLTRAAHREQMVDRFLVSTLEAAKHGEELAMLQGALDTASGVSAIAGIASGNPAALGAATALGITATAIKGVQVTVQEGRVRYHEKKRVVADGELAQNAADVWKALAGVGQAASDESEGIQTQDSEPQVARRIGEGVTGARYQNSMWFKEDMAKLIVQRMALNPEREVYGRILKLCGEKRDALHPEKIKSMSHKQKAALLTRIEHKISGRENTVQGVKKGLKLTIQSTLEKIGDAFAEFRNLLHGIVDKLAFKQYKSITAKVSELQMAAEKRGWSPEQVTTQLFDAAIEEGPDSARALRELIHIKGGGKEWRDTKKSERIEMRLDRIGKLLDTIEADPVITIEDAARQVRVSWVEDRSESPESE